MEQSRRDTSTATAVLEMETGEAPPSRRVLTAWGPGSPPGEGAECRVRYTDSTGRLLL